MPQAPALACRIHHGYRRIHRCCHDLLTGTRHGKEATMTIYLINRHLLLLEQNIKTVLQCTKRREQMRAA